VRIYAPNRYEWILFELNADLLPEPQAAAAPLPPPPWFFVIARNSGVGDYIGQQDRR